MDNPLGPNPIAQLAKDKISIAYRQGHGLRFSLSTQPDLAR